jgi:hypothetical protein
MSKSRHTEAQMIGALKQLEAGRKAEDVQPQAIDVNKSSLKIRVFKSGAFSAFAQFCTRSRNTGSN